MTDELLPDRHVPSQLRRVAYACCNEELVERTYRAWAGPDSNLHEMLEEVPPHPDKNPVILRFNLDKTSEVLYRWNEEGACWVRVQDQPRATNTMEVFWP